MTDLFNRFKEFASEIEGSENIDTLKMNPNQAASNKGDFFFSNRKIICEDKLLKKDKSFEVSRVLEERHKLNQKQIIYDEAQLSLFLRTLTHADGVDRRLLYKVFSTIDRAVKKANKQIRATKSTFNLPDSQGVLVILNDSIDVLSPSLVARRLQDLFCERTKEGTAKYPHVAAALYISEQHYVESNTGKAVPVVSVVNDLSEKYNHADQFVQLLTEEWAKFNHTPLYSSKDHFPEQLQCQSFTERRIIIL